MRRQPRLRKCETFTKCYTAIIYKIYQQKLNKLYYENFYCYFYVYDNSRGFVNLKNLRSATMPNILSLIIIILIKQK